jgi:hypothetical protein
MSGRVGSITTDIIADGLVFNMDAANRACYPRTGTTATDTINSLSGSFVNQVSFTDSNFGIWDFDGTDDVINCEGFNINTTFSMNVWVNNDLSSPSYKAFLASPHYHENGFNGNWVFRVTNNGSVAFASYDGSSSEQYAEISVSTMAAGTWYNLCCTGDGTNVNIYQNGIFKGSNTHTKDLADTAQGLFIGGEQPGHGTDHNTEWNGKIACTQIYNRVLSAEEVLYNYNGLRGRFGV